MSLKIILKPEEKIVINQAVIINGKYKTEFTVENKSAILRKKDILQPEQATSPCKGLYYLIQLVYLFPETEEQNLPLIHKLAQDICAAAPTLSAQILQVLQSLQQQEFYKALKTCHKAILVEEEILRDDK